ncbi:MAG: hypothetical protein E6Z95_00810 [Haemophilus parainfluenzae]|nr:hypothetical protein [Haemophilus parainfluenzae]
MRQSAVGFQKFFPCNAPPLLYNKPQIPKRATAMIEHYLQQIQQLCPSLSRQALDFIGNGFRLRELPPKAFFLKAGEVLRANGGDVSRIKLAFILLNR